MTRAPAAPSRTYRIMFALAAIVAAIAYFFFVIGVGDGTVSSFNIAMWLVLLAVVTAVLVVGRWLGTSGHPRAAVAVLSVLALPALLYALFMFVVIVSGERWN